VPSRRADPHDRVDSATASGSAEAVFSILVDLDGGGIDTSVYEGERRIVHSTQAPSALGALLPGASDPVAGTGRDRLRKYFLENGNAFPVSVRLDRRVSPVRWEGYACRGTRTEANLADGRMLVLSHRVVTGHGTRRGAMVREGFWFDLQAGNFGLLPRDGGWRAWHRVRRYLSLKGVHPREEDVPGRKATYLISEIERYGFPAGDDFLTEETGLQLRVEGRPVIPEATAPVLRLAIQPAENSRAVAVIRPGIRIEGRVFPVADELLRLFRHDSVPHAARRGDGEEKWFCAILDALDPETAQSGGTALSRSAAEAVELLKDGAGMVVPVDGRWVSYRSDPLRQARLLDIPFRIFGGKIFQGGGPPGELRVPGDAVAPGLHALLSRTQAEGIELAYSDSAVVPATGVRVSVEAVRGQVDWFELRPEITLDGQVLDEESWGDALIRDGFILRGGRLLVLDPSMRDVLKAVAASVKRGRRGERGRVVRIPRLAILDILELRRHGVRVVLPEADRIVLERLARLDRVPEMPVAEALRTTLRHYQREGVDWLAFLYENRFGACLADDMGLGKTVQAIAFLAAIKEGIVTSRAPGFPSLVVMPPSLLFNWESEVARFYPGLRYVVYRGKGRSAGFEDVDLVLTTYDIVRRDISSLSTIPFDAIVFDEAQAVKNLFAKSTGAARRLRCAFSVALTGTPVENHLGEYFSILDLVVPGILGDYDDVRRKIRREDPDFLDAVRRRSRPFVLRRAKESILPELPPKLESDIFLELSDRQKSLYRRAADSAREEIENAYRTHTDGRARVIALTAILRLRQLCLSPELLLPSRRENSPKIEFLMTRLEALRDEGHSVLVFSQFTTYLDLVERAMGERGMKAMRLDGATPVPERKRRVERFQQGEAPSVFLLSLKAGGKGLNLVKASYVILLDPWWNPAVERQAADRAHRIGQSRKVSVLRLLMRHTVEEKMVALSERKAGLYKALLGDPGARGGAPLSRDDFAFLLERPE
jgi:non-specific serine/threonine protein kinase